MFTTSNCAMCGIAGIFRPSSPEQANREFVETAADTMLHRGPDGRGVFVDGPVALAMTRLAIIDVEGSSQPLFNETGDVALVCNGEIYNYRELREELAGRGHRLRTNGDCETLVHLYEDFGLDGFSRLRGMFAFVLWDRRTETMVVGRDRLGIKPLYWVALGATHAFCSELRGLVSSGLAANRLAEEPTLGYLRYTHSVHGDRSLLSDVRRVPSGCLVEVNRHGSRLVRYWDEPSPSYGGCLQEVFAELEDASRLHQRADVESAVLLSSGIDSSLIAALAVRAGHRPRVFTAGYRRDSAQDESLLAEAFARQLGLSPERVLVDDDDLRRGFEEMSSRVDEPAADPSSVVQWLLYRHARQQGCRVVHTGIGGDEVFLGYTAWNRVCLALEANASMPKATRVLGPLLHAVAYRHMPSLGGDEGLMGIQPASMARARILSGLLGRSLAPSAAPSGVRTWDGFDDAYRSLRRTYLVNNGLLLADKLGMAASVEVRVPLVDHLVLEATLALPLSMKRPQRGFAKPVLRAALERVGCAAWNTRTKKGFEIPPALVRQMLRVHLDEIRESSTARAMFSPERWRTLIDTFSETARDAKHPSLVRDRLHRRAWVFSLASQPDAWSVSTFLFSILCLDRCRKYWSSPVPARQSFPG
jgi:asparagine synthase (glutamine-hydrolysing)